MFVLIQVCFIFAIKKGDSKILFSFCLLLIIRNNQIIHKKSHIHYKPTVQIFIPTRNPVPGSQIVT